MAALVEQVGRGRPTLTGVPEEAGCGTAASNTPRIFPDEEHVVVRFEVVGLVGLLSRQWVPVAGGEMFFPAAKT